MKLLSIQFMCVRKISEIKMLKIFHLKKKKNKLFAMFKLYKQLFFFFDFQKVLSSSLLGHSMK